MKSSTSPAPEYDVVSGHCMGGGLDLELACHRRFAAPQALFGQRGAALGLVTGWGGGTQRLPRLIGMAHALEMFVAAERITAEQALHGGGRSCLSTSGKASRCATRNFVRWKRSNELNAQC
jgi:enoyl-CoA hydratase/carnithine racemase